MEQLRDKEKGCEWDKEQDFKSIAPFTIEEAYEVADAIARENHNDLKLELGDLLLQVVFLSQIAKEEGLFKFEDVANAISHKLISRHPYVFENPKEHTPDEQLESWENSKAKEREELNFTSLMDDITLTLPALMRSQKIQKRASRVGFDWSSIEGYFKKIEEERLLLFFVEKMMMKERRKKEKKKRMRRVQSTKKEESGDGGGGGSVVCCVVGYY